MKTTKELAKRAYPEYRGRTFREDRSGRVMFHDTNWGGGTRNSYRSLSLDGNAGRALPSFAPWANPVEGQSGIIPPGWCVVMHTIFCGKDLGCTVYYPAAPALDATGVVYIEAK